MTKLTPDQAAININKKWPNITLIYFVGKDSKLNEFYDEDYGTFFNKYDYVMDGAKHPQRVKEARQKAARDPERRKKAKETLLKNYGVENPSSAQSVKDKKKQTTLKNFGVENPSQSELVKEKKRQTSFINFGTFYYQGLREILEKKRQTCLNKYGVEASSQSEIIKAQVKARNLIKWGTTSPMHNKDIVNRMTETKIAKGLIRIYSEGKTVPKIASETNVCISQINIIARRLGVEEAERWARDPGRNSATVLERLVEDILKRHNTPYIFNKKLKGKRPDFLIPTHNLIIECDGLRWHCDFPKHGQSNNAYHKEKQQYYLGLGYQSLFFRQDEIMNKIDIIESIILNKLNLSTKIFARKCLLKEINKEESKAFFIANHLMGNGSGKAFGLFFQDELVAAMQIVNKQEGLHISRFCTKLNTSVTGGFSKLLKYCINSRGAKKVISFVDLRYGNGKSLENLGFKKETEYLSFKWCDIRRNKTFHRMAFPGNLGYSQGLYKIWDCGQAKFTLDIITS
jgi:very-short-patch-repair endonuclease